MADRWAKERPPQRFDPIGSWSRRDFAQPPEANGRSRQMEVSYISGGTLIDSERKEHG